MKLPPSRLGLSGHAFSDWTPESLLSLMTTRLGIRALDYWPVNRGSLDMPAYADLLQSYDVHVYCVNAPSTGGRLMAPGETGEAQATLLNAISEAEALGAPYVQFYTGVPEWPEFVTVVKTLARYLAPVLDRAAQAGVMLLLENNLDQRGEDIFRLNPSRTPEMVFVVLEEIGSPIVRLSYDPCNFYTVGAEGYPYAYELLKPYIVNVHMKDCVRYSPLVYSGAAEQQKLLTDSASGPHLPVPVGQGAINWDGILRKLAADGYDGWLTLDPFSLPAPLIAWCEESLAYLLPRIAGHDSLAGMAAYQGELS